MEAVVEQHLNAYFQGENNMIEEKRKHRRIPFSRPVCVTNFSGEKATMKATDFSLDGVCFSSNQPKTVGDILTVTMNIGAKGKVKIIQAKGEIVYRYFTNNEYLMGMRFYQDS